jgi:hypothetical protein
MVAASIAVLERGARFVEVGKRDIWSPQRAAQERPDLAYHLIAIDFWTPDVVGANMRRLAAMLHSGTRTTSILHVSKDYYIITIITCFSCHEARCICRQAAVKAARFLPLLDSPDPSKTQSIVGTVLSIYTAPRQPGTTRYH